MKASLQDDNDNDTELDKVMKASLQDNDENSDMLKAINASLELCKSPDLYSSNNTENTIITGEQAPMNLCPIDNEIEEEIEEKVLDDDINNTINDTINKDDEKFCVCLDLRIYGSNPTQSIYVFGTEYFLDSVQLSKIKIIWGKVNPDTPAGVRYKQDRDYDKAVYDHMKNEGLLQHF